MLLEFWICNNCVKITSWNVNLKCCTCMKLQWISLTVKMALFVICSLQDVVFFFVVVARAVPPYRPIMQIAWGLTLRRGPHLAEGASSCGGSLNWATNAAHLCAYVAQLVWYRRCEAPLAWSDFNTVETDRGKKQWYVMWKVMRVK